jgi:hypothetical protein
MFEKLNKIKKELIPKCEMVIDFKGVVSTPQEITDVLIHYCDDGHKDLVILKESMTPIAKIDGKVYIVRTDRLVGMIGGGVKLDTPHPLHYQGYGLGDQRLYVYSYDYIED